MSLLRERLVRVEERLDRLVETGRQAHADLKELLAAQRTAETRLERALADVEREQARTRTHLRWMKGIWAAVQGAVLAWFGRG